MVKGGPVILIVLRRWDVQASSQSWGKGASSHPHRRAEKSMLAVVRRGGVQSFFHPLAVRCRSANNPPWWTRTRSPANEERLAGKAKASNRYLCSNGLGMVLAVHFGYCYNYQSCLNETYRCNLAQQMSGMHAPASIRWLRG